VSRLADVDTGTRRPEARVERLDVRVFEVPTDGPDGRESDGTFEWESTTIVVVHAHGGGRAGLGYTYADRSVAELVRSKLAHVAEGSDALEPAATWPALGAALRNAGRPGAGFMALSAVDTALWDLKARLLELPLVDLLPVAHDAVPVYGSGGFCNYPLARLQQQLGGWIAGGIPRVKLKIGRRPQRDPARLDAAREAIGADAELYADANGAFTRKQALAWAERLAADWRVSWFEEPVSSAELDGLRFLHARGPAGLDIAAGEYAFVPADFRNIVDAVDCLQVDVTRCGGITGVLGVAGLAAAHAVDVSSHGAPQLSAHALCAVQRLRHLEYFHDHVRVERLLFDGVLEPDGGALRPDRSVAGHGLELKLADAEPYAV
jgi:L-alanine-DL-glutamate epimerase-like enolase superfamily enzyme